MHLATIVVLLHPGAFVWGGAHMEQSNVDALRARGVEATSLNYALGSPSRAERSAAKFVCRLHRKRRVVAWGMSAGGTLALSLASRGCVDAAMAVSPVTDLTTWVPGQGFWSLSERLVTSPLYMDRPKCPVFVQHADNDDVVPVSQSVRYTRKMRTKLVRVASGGHTIVEGHSQSALNWVIKQSLSRSRGQVGHQR